MNNKLIEDIFPNTLENNKYNNIIKHLDIIKDFLAKIANKNNVLGIILFGSLTGKLFGIELKKNTKINDIDLLIITTDNFYQNEIKLYNEMVIEFLYFPKEFCKQFIISRSPLLIHIFYDGYILLDKSGDIRKLKTLAKRLFFKGPKKLPKYSLFAKIKDLNKLLQEINNIKHNTYLKKYFIYASLVKCIELYFVIFNKWFPNIKNILKHIRYYSQNYFVIIKKFLEADNVNIQIKYINILYKKLLSNCNNINFNKSPKGYVHFKIKKDKK